MLIRGMSSEIETYRRGWKRGVRHGTLIYVLWVIAFITGAIVQGKTENEDLGEMDG